MAEPYSKEELEPFRHPHAAYARRWIATVDARDEEIRRLRELLSEVRSYVGASSLVPAFGLSERIDAALRGST